VALRGPYCFALKTLSAAAVALLFALGTLKGEVSPTGGAAIQSAKLEGGRQVALQVQNSGPAAAEFRLPAGSIFQGSGGTRLITLREAAATVPPGGAGDVAVPAASLSGGAPGPAEQTARLTADSEPRLKPLLQYLAAKNDVPRGTSQCAVLALLDNVTYARWQQFETQCVPNAAPTDALLEALDAVAILHAVAPQGTFQLQSDPELKLRALRQPGTRAKALQLFGMTIPGDTVTAGQPPPNLGQLMHTKEGDNCPICRMRAQMQRPASDL
jgi:hypothetical protein